MLSSRIRSQPATVPVGLLTAAIDLINVVKPAPRDVDRLITELVLRLDYDRSTAHALVTRIRATARMFSDPRWPVIRQWGHGLSSEQRFLFEVLVQRFVAEAALDTGGFDLGALLMTLLAELPAPRRARATMYLPPDWPHDGQRIQRAQRRCPAGAAGRTMPLDAARVSAPGAASTPTTRAPGRGKARERSAPRKRPETQGTQVREARNRGRSTKRPAAPDQRDKRS